MTPDRGSLLRSQVPERNPCKMEWLNLKARGYFSCRGARVDSSTSLQRTAATCAWDCRICAADGKENSFAKISAHRTRGSAGIHCPVLGRIDRRRADGSAVSLRDIRSQYHRLPGHWIHPDVAERPRRNQSCMAVHGRRRFHRRLQHVLHIRVGDSVDFALRGFGAGLALCGGKPHPGPSSHMVRRCTG
jgi:hypothetical protein